MSIKNEAQAKVTGVARNVAGVYIGSLVSILSTSPRFIDMLGVEYGGVRCVGYVGIINGRAAWAWECRCGMVFRRLGIDMRVCIKSGTPVSCGCMLKKIRAANGKKNKRHGLSKTLLYSVHRQMIQRCHNPKNKSYRWYGARGLVVCSEWRSFDTFFTWAISSGYGCGLSIERKNVNAGYSPDNCCWIPLKEQAKNRRKRTAR